MGDATPEDEDTPGTTAQEDLNPGETEEAGLWNQTDWSGPDIDDDHNNDDNDDNVVQVLKESIEAAGRKPCQETNLNEGNLLKKNIEILLEWTIPEDYMETFRQANKSVEEILEELAG